MAFFVLVIGLTCKTFTDSFNNPVTPTPSSHEPESSWTPIPPQHKAVDDLELVDNFWGYAPYGSRVIKGHVYNSGAHRFRYVQVEINLYDRDGNQVGSTMANLNNLEPGGTWAFEAPIFEDNAVRAKVTDVTGF